MTTLKHNAPLSDIIQTINTSKDVSSELGNVLIVIFTILLRDANTFHPYHDSRLEKIFTPLSEHLTACSDEYFVRTVQLPITLIDSIQRQHQINDQFMRQIRYQFLRLMIAHPLFSDMAIQLVLSPILSKLAQSKFYIQNHEKGILLVLWMKKIAEAQCQKPLSEDLVPIIKHCFIEQDLESLFLYKKERDRALKLLEAISSPPIPLYISKLPIEVIGEQTVISEKVYVAATDWPLKIATDFNAMPNDTQNLWREVWQHATTATTAQPSTTWLKQATPLAESLKPSFSPQLNQWLTTILADVPRKDAPLSQKNAQLVRGLLWFAGLGDVKYFTKLMSAYVKFFYHKVAGLGPRSTIVANAALYSLGQQGVSGVIQLSKLRDEITYATGQKAIENALTEASKKQE